MAFAHLRLAALPALLSLALAAPLLAQEPPPGEGSPPGKEPPPAKEPGRVLVLDLKVDGEVASGLVTSLTTLLSARMSRTPGVVVMTNEDLRHLVSFEEMKDALACDEASCLTDIGNALGARRVLTGNITRVGEIYVVSYTLMDLDELRPIARETLRGSAEDLLAGIDGVADRFAAAARTGEALVQGALVAEPRGSPEAPAGAGGLGLRSARVPEAWISLEDETYVTGDQNGVSTRKVTVAYQGPHRKPLPDNELYRAVGRADLAAQYEQTAGLMWASFLTGIGVIVVGTVGVIGGTLWLVQQPMGYSSPALLGLVVGGPVVIGGLGGLLLMLPVAIDPNPLPPHERRRLVDEHNGKLLSHGPLVPPALALSFEVE